MQNIVHLKWNVQTKEENRTRNDELGKSGMIEMLLCADSMILQFYRCIKV